MLATEDMCVLDATIRDGGLVNDFHFTDEFVKAVYDSNVAAGVDYMEFGYRADRSQLDPQVYGKWKFASDEDIRAIVGDNDSGMKLSVMCDVGRCNYRKDFHPKSESPVDLIRVATYIDTIRQAMEIIEYADFMGYEVSCNIMAISKCSDTQLEKALDILKKSPVMGVYIVDSYGALYPKDIARLTELFKDKLLTYEKQVGIHTHNNQQCALANTITAIDFGAKLVDGTAYGMGRGAGNCHMEALLGYMKNNRYRIDPILKLIKDYMIPLKESGVEWGYNTNYLITGLCNVHPRTAIQATKEKKTDFVSFRRQRDTESGEKSEM